MNLPRNCIVDQLRQPVIEDAEVDQRQSVGAAQTQSCELRFWRLVCVVGFLQREKQRV